MTWVLWGKPASPRRLWAWRPSGDTRTSSLMATTGSLTGTSRCWSSQSTWTSRQSRPAVWPGPVTGPHSMVTLWIILSSVSSNLKPSVRHNKFPTFSGKPAQAYGWGATVSGGTYSDKGGSERPFKQGMRFCGLGLNRSQSSQIRDLEKYFAQHFVLTFGSV